MKHRYRKKDITNRQLDKVFEAVEIIDAASEGAGEMLDVFPREKDYTHLAILPKYLKRKLIRANNKAQSAVCNLQMTVDEVNDWMNAQV